MRAVRDIATKRLVRWEADGEPEPGREIVDVPYTTPEEAHAAAVAAVGGPEHLADITIADNGIAVGIMRGPEKLDRLEEFGLIALLRYGKANNKRPTDPVTYGDLAAVAKQLRERTVALADEDL